MRTRLRQSTYLFEEHLVAGLLLHLTLGPFLSSIKTRVQVSLCARPRPRARPWTPDKPRRRRHREPRHVARTRGTRVKNIHQTRPRISARIAPPHARASVPTRAHPRSQ